MIPRSDLQWSKLGVHGRASALSAVAFGEIYSYIIRSNCNGLISGIGTAQQSAAIQIRTTYEDSQDNQGNETAEHRTPVMAAARQGKPLLREVGRLLTI